MTNKQRQLATLFSASLCLSCISAKPINATQAQYLPTEARWCMAQGCIELEIPKTVEQFQKGLMQRPDLGPWRGMWFRFSPAQAVGFWMHKCIVPLDLVFIRDGKVVEVKAKLPPCPRLPCPSYDSKELVDGVIELQAGRAAALGIKAGSPAIPKLD